MFLLYIPISCCMIAKFSYWAKKTIRVTFFNAQDRFTKVIHVPLQSSIQNILFYNLIHKNDNSTIHFCTCTDSTAVGACAKFFGDRYKNANYTLYTFPWFREENVFVKQTQVGGSIDDRTSYYVFHACLPTYDWREQWWLDALDKLYACNMQRSVSLEHTVARSSLM